MRAWVIYNKLTGKYHAGSNKWKETPKVYSRKSDATGAVVFHYGYNWPEGVAVHEVQVSEPEVALTEADFYKLPPEKQRVKLARDVIKALKTSFMMIPKRGNSYFSPIEDTCYSSPKMDQETLKKMAAEEKTCHVCALGAVMVTKLLNYNEGSLRRGWHLDEFQEQLNKVFPVTTLAKIEACFEGFTNIGVCLDDDVDDACRRFYYKHKALPPADHICAIMQNIVDHNGEMVP